MAKRVGSTKKSTRRNLVAHLAQLETAQLVRAAGEWEYLFKHTLTQETIYGSLLRSARREIHTCVAQTYEELYADRLDEYAAPLAQHYAQAGDEVKTLAYAMRAGDVAARMYANIEAIMHYTRAIEIAKRVVGVNHASLLHDLCLKRGRAFEHCGQFAQALENYQTMESLARERNDRAMELAALVARATLHATPTPLQNLALGRELLDHALTLARESKDRAAETKILWNLMLIEYFAGNHAPGIEYGERAIAIARELGLTEQLAFVLNDIARNYSAIGDPQRARAALEQAREMWRALDNLPMLSDNLGTAADMFFAAGEYTQALAVAEEAYRIGQSIGNLWNQAYSRWTAGAIQIDRGEFQAGIAALEETMALGDQAGFTVATWAARTTLGLFYAEIGLPQQGIALIEPLIPQIQGRDVPFKVWGLAILGYLHWLIGNAARADELIEQAKQDANREDLSQYVPVVLAIAESAPAFARQEYDKVIQQTIPLIAQYRRLRAHPFRSDVILLAGRALRGQGNRDAAFDILIEARDEAQTVGVRRTLWQILAELAGIERERGNQAQAGALNVHAREIIEYIFAHSPDKVRQAMQNQPSVRGVMENAKPA